MKALVITQQFGRRWSGLGTYATNLVDGLVNRGVAATVVCPEGMGEGSRARIVHIKSRRWQKAVNYWLPLSYEFGKTLRQLSRSETFDVIHFTDAREALFAEAGGAPTVGTMNDYYAAASSFNPLYFRRHYSDWPIRYPYYQFMRAVEPLALKKLDRIIANSNFVCGILNENYSIARERIRVINYGIEARIGFAESLRLEGNPSILFIGANFQRKGLPDLMRACAAARNAIPELRVHVIGDDPKIKVMQKLATELGISESICFHGLVPNEQVRSMKADMLVMPSLVEGFGIVFLEAMSAGIPVIGGAVGGTIELIKDGMNGFAVKPGDVEGLARKITRLAADKALRGEIVKRGFETVKLYTIEKMVSETISLYESLTAERR